MEPKWVDFKKEPVHDLQTPKEVIQGFEFEDLGGPSGTAGLKIIELPLKTKTQNQFFISQGRVKVSPAKRLEVRSFQVMVLAEHYLGGTAQPTIEAYDHAHNPVDIDVGAKVPGKPEKLVVMDAEISYIEIEGTEVAIEKLCFFF